MPKLTIGTSWATELGILFITLTKASSCGLSQLTVRKPIDNEAHSDEEDGELINNPMSFYEASRNLIDLFLPFVHAEEEGTSFDRTL
jgi:hypothetical protein